MANRRGRLAYVPPRVLDELDKLSLQEALKKGYGGRTVAMQMMVDNAKIARYIKQAHPQLYRRAKKRLEWY